MPNTSPYDMIHKARRYAAAADRWAVLKANTHDRTPVNPPISKAPEAQAAPMQPAPYQPAPQAEPANPPLMQPPFPPPQPRHPYMDEIAQRHEQAWKTASPLQAWKPEPPAQGTWQEPTRAAPTAAPEETPASPARAREHGPEHTAAVPEPWMEA